MTLTLQQCGYDGTSELRATDGVLLLSASVKTTRLVTAKCTAATRAFAFDPNGSAAQPQRAVFARFGVYVEDALHRHTAQRLFA